MTHGRIGSSPLARGTAAMHHGLVFFARFIPAGAGNRNPAGQQPGQPSVHPRWRGEQSAAGIFAPTSSGSSPLARGTDQRQRPQKPFQRFIPAGAGNSIFLCDGRTSRSVHPRWRGEQPLLFHVQNVCFGSSPLARGTVQRRADRLRDRRFIPAGAGNRISALLGPSSRAVHPRWRGEQFSTFFRTW